MKKLILLYLISLSYLGQSQSLSVPTTHPTMGNNPIEKISIVQVFIEDHEQLHDLDALDVGADHIHYDEDGAVELYLTQNHIKKIEAHGFQYKVKVEDYQKYYRDRAQREAPYISSFQRMTRTANNFGYGSMGGFYTYDEMVDKLDEMETLYPDIVKAKYSIGTTIENRTIWAVKISDNPDVDEDEPAVYYDAVHHAREPLSMAVTINYMFWLLENYETDPQVEYIVNTRELYFVPMVNPDGYVYNETTNPNGGGLWRKNRRDNNDGTYGVDLNRNYSHAYDFDSSCSSNSPNSNTYSGTGPFSEPETAAVRDFVADINPTVAFSSHSTAGKYLMPYGYDTAPPEFPTYSEWASDFLSDNNYPYGVTFQMLGYTSCGTTRDYLHNEGIYGWTPEIGGSGFWPAQSEIFGRVDENVGPLFYQAWICGGFADFQSHSIVGEAVAGGSLTMSVELKNKGVGANAGNIEVSLEPASPLITVSVPQNFPDITQQTKVNNSTTPFNISVDSAYADGTVSIDVVIKQEGIESSRESVTFYVGTKTTIFSDDAESGINNWTSSGNGISWGLIEDDSYSGDYSFGDSDGGNCENNTSNYFTLNPTLDFTNTSKPVINSFNKWSLDNGDRVELQISTNGGNSYSTLKTYTLNSKWTQESIDLSVYNGVSNLKLRYFLFSDGDTNADGFYFDDFSIADYDCPDCPLCDIYENNFPSSESFESGTGDWSQVTDGSDDINWTEQTGPTPSSNTGPNEAAEGSVYLYVEASNPNNPAKTAILESPCFDFRNSTSASLEFQYHMYGTTNDMKLEAEVSIDKGTNWTNVGFEITGNQGNQWNSQSIDLGAYLGEMINLRFIGTTGESWQGDVSIDDIQVLSEIISCSIGDPCDDGDSCTTGETLDSNCNCTGGTLLDSDNDGVCDEEDQCADFDDNLIGMSCDDGDICTIGETYNTNCECAGGIFQDTDNDGVCDAEDQCPDFDDNLIGTSCDDGDSCTENDVFGVDCNCSGTPISDSDGDGICDANDLCPDFDDSLIGSPCDDGNLCTEGETYDTNCNCSGGIFQDSDNDGICDAEDLCPSLDDNLIGTTCDDNDPCTDNDTYSVDCDCVGIYSGDSDNDGICNNEDQCPNFDDNLIGTPCDDGNDCTQGETFDSDCGCSGGMEADNDNDGVCNALDPCPDDAYDICTLPNYCTSQGNSTQYEHISQVIFNDLDNTSGDNGGYADFTSLAATVQSGQSYNITLVPGFASGSYSEYWNVWIDYNQDGDFEDADENIISQASNSTITESITIPSALVLNGGTRMRVSMKYSFSSTSCEIFSEGEVEDYTILITAECVVGELCDDNDPCTIGESLDANCNCTGGILYDDDNDGICNSEDQCPDFDDNLIGTSCDDGDPCTIGETYDLNCGCSGGIFQDSDGDSICDAEDQCPDFNNLLIGTSCDDGDPCTDNDNYNDDCNCSGTPSNDSDSDGICDNEDQCPDFDDNLIGTACDDGDICTSGETYDANCNCSGGTFQDDDNDGICNAEDLCPTLDDALIGTACDDGNNCTSGETYDTNCNCSGGIIEDDDNDGICNSEDQCPDFDDNLIGTPCDDGDVCTSGETYDANCGCSGGTFQDADNDGVCDAEDQCPGYDDSEDINNDGIIDGCATCPFYNWNNESILSYDSGQDFGPYIIEDNGNTFYMDGNAWKAIDINYEVTSNTIIQFDFKSTVEGEIHEIGFDNDLIVAPDHRIVVYGDQGYDGTFNNEKYTSAGEWQSFTISLGNNFTGLYQYLVLTADDDASSAGNSYFRNVKIYEDLDGDLACDISCVEGEICEDGNPCTINSTYDSNCNCVGGENLPDDDGDGICNLQDQCPDFDDGLIGTACDDGNSCTIGETYNTDCDCIGGLFTDNDNDGICIGEDPDDSDPCNPNSDSAACSNCETVNFDDMESGFAFWNDGGSDCYWDPAFGIDDTRSIRIRDNSGSVSSMFTDIIDMSAYLSANISFTYFPVSMENNEDFFLEYSLNGGQSFTIIEEWNRGVEFENNIRYFEDVSFEGIDFTSNMVFRFRCDASGNADKIYIDNVLIEGCYTESTQEKHASSIRNKNQKTIDLSRISLYPNPAHEKLFLDTKGMFNEGEKLFLSIYGMDGKLALKNTISASEIIEVDLNNISKSQPYFLRLTTFKGQTFTHSFVKID